MEGSLRRWAVVTYLAVGTSMLVTVLVATLIPAVRAARIDPLTAMRR